MRRSSLVLSLFAAPLLFGMLLSGEVNASAKAIFDELEASSKDPESTKDKNASTDRQQQIYDFIALICRFFPFLGFCDKGGEAPGNGGICRCGPSTVRIGTKVVGGENAIKGEIPWQIALTTREKNIRQTQSRELTKNKLLLNVRLSDLRLKWVNEDKTSFHLNCCSNLANIYVSTGFVFCGGSLLNAGFVMTAAHCTSGRSASSLFVVVGMLKMSRPSHGQSFGLTRKSEHLGYAKNPTRYDFSILQLSGSVNFADSRLSHVSPICWPTSRSTVGADAIISGWGTLYRGGSRPDAMQKATVNIISDTVCNSTEAYNGWIRESMVCAGIYPSGGIDTCQGDSGGPLVTKEGSSWVLTGATSWGSGCAWANKPGVYAEVYDVRAWIATTTGGTECTRT